MNELSELVRRAQQGDADAFAEIITRFQAMACAIGFTMLDDATVAEDIAQEAFIEAYYCLPQLREPAAFPGWFRRIVIKQCDRQLRRRRPEVPLDEAWIAGKGDPALLFDEQASHQAVRQAIAQLPPRQRVVTVLYYLNGLSQQEIVDYLELPLTTVKKQLFDARRKLRIKMSEVIDMYQGPARNDQLPSQESGFRNRVMFFIALKKHDLVQVMRLLDQSPELINAAFEWGIASEGYFWPQGYTVIHWAVATNDRPMLEALLARGAKVNAVATRDNSTPLHVAAAMQRPELTRLLLETGADPNALDVNDQTPLHHAAWANQPAIVSSLLQYGANWNLKDAGGRTPADWAAIKHAQSALDVLAAYGASWSPTLPMPMMPLKHDASLFETGLKVIDLCAPFKHGGRNALFTSLSGVGKMVTVNYLIDALAKRYGGHTIWLGLEHGLFVHEGLELEERGAGLADVITFVFAQEEEPASYLRAAQSAVAGATHAARQGQHVMLLVAAPIALADGVQVVLEGATYAEGASSITLVYYGQYTVGALPEAFDSLDAAVAFEHWRARQGWFPAVDVLNSFSRLLNERDAGERHTRLARQTRRLLRRYQDLMSMPEGIPRGMDGLPVEDDTVLLKRARLIHEFLTQAMPQTELMTHRPGEYVPLSETLDGCEAILAGKLDDAAEGG